MDAIGSGTLQVPSWRRWLGLGDWIAFGDRFYTRLWKFISHGVRTFGCCDKEGGGYMEFAWCSTGVSILLY